MSIDGATGLSDGLVLFGATGDLARKKLFPAVYEMQRNGSLDSVPVDRRRRRRTGPTTTSASGPGPRCSSGCKGEPIDEAALNVAHRAA